MSWAITAMLVSAALNQYNTNRTAKKQDRVAAEGIRKNERTRQEANARLNRTIDMTAKSRPDDERSNANQQYLDVVRQQLSRAQGGLNAQGVSDQYAELAAPAATGVADYGTVLSGLLSRMDAPALQRQGEANSFGDLGMDLSVLSGNVGQDDFLTRLKMNNVRRNPWLDLAAGVAQGYASGVSKGAGGLSGASVANTPSYVPIAGGGRAVYNSYGGYGGRA